MNDKQDEFGKDADQTRYIKYIFILSVLLIISLFALEVAGLFVSQQRQQMMIFTGELTHQLITILIAGFVGQTLAGVSILGQLGIGTAAIAGLELLASSFHIPENDALARRAGIAEGLRQLERGDNSFGRQSAADLVANFQQGFASVIDNNARQQTIQSTEPIQIQIDIDSPIQADGTEIARLVHRETIRLENRNILVRR